jgi:hypothetical protein
MINNSSGIPEGNGSLQEHCGKVSRGLPDLDQFVPMDAIHLKSGGNSRLIISTNCMIPDVGIDNRRLVRSVISIPDPSANLDRLFSIPSSFDLPLVYRFLSGELHYDFRDWIV